MTLGCRPPVSHALPARAGPGPALRSAGLPAPAPPAHAAHKVLFALKLVETGQGSSPRSLLVPSLAQPGKQLGGFGAGRFAPSSSSGHADVCPFPSSKEEVSSSPSTGFLAGFS